MTSKTYANLRDQMAIHAELLRRSTPLDGDESVRVWLPNESRETVIRAVANPKLNANHVRGVMNELGIKVSARLPERTETERLRDTVLALETRVRDLEQWRADLEGTTTNITQFKKA